MSVSSAYPSADCCRDSLSFDLSAQVMYSNQVYRTRTSLSTSILISLIAEEEGINEGGGCKSRKTNKRGEGKGSKHGPGAKNVKSLNKIHEGGGEICNRLINVRRTIEREEGKI